MKINFDELYKTVVEEIEDFELNGDYDYDYEEVIEEIDCDSAEALEGLMKSAKYNMWTLFENILESCIDELEFEQVTYLCKNVYNDDYNRDYLDTLMHKIETLFNEDKEEYINAIVTGFASNSNATEWAYSFLRRAVNAGCKELICDKIEEMIDTEDCSGLETFMDEYYFD